MARVKRQSAVLNKALHRVAGMRSISQSLQFSDGSSLAGYDARIQALQTHLSSYNTMLAGVDEMAGRIALLEQDLRGYSEKMLLNVAAHYGRDSLQYVQAGGTARKRTKSAWVNAAANAAAPSADKAATNGSSTPV